MSSGILLWQRHYFLTACAKIWSSSELVDQESSLEFVHKDVRLVSLNVLLVYSVHGSEIRLNVQDALASLLMHRILVLLVSRTALQ